MMLAQGLYLDIDAASGIHSLVLGLSSPLMNNESIPHCSSGEIRG